MKILKTIILSLLLVPYNIYAACIGSSPSLTASSANYADVLDCVNASNSGDTVNIPAGSATWGASLQITKGITIKGSGAGSTTITSNLADQSNGLISYKPDESARKADALFRVTGITFDLNNMANGCHAIYLYNNSATPVTKTRIDHNEFRNSLGGTGTKRMIYVMGAIYGVADNNTFNQCNHCVDGEGAGSTTEWANLTVSYGSANNFYVEDNTFTNNNVTYGPVFMAGGHGGRYAARYNTFSVTGKSYNVMPLFDMHGNQTAGYGMMINELYGNVWSIVPINNSNYIIDQRGSRVMAFFNKLETNTNTTGHYFRLREEYADSNSTAPSGNPGTYLMHVTDTYYWNNRHTTYSNYLISASIAANDECCGANAGYGQDSACCYNGGGTKGIAMNIDAFTQGASFNATSGVGCGTLANRPATCSKGVGYWATNQSCSDLTGMVGKNPTTPISGTLFICGATGWADGSTYTPYAYPHPLRNPKPPVNVHATAEAM